MVQSHPVTTHTAPMNSTEGSKFPQQYFLVDQSLRSLELRDVPEPKLA